MCSRTTVAWLSKSSAIFRVTRRKASTACLLWPKVCSANSRLQFIPKFAACIARSLLCCAKSDESRAIAFSLEDTLCLFLCWMFVTVLLGQRISTRLVPATLKVSRDRPRKGSLFSNDAWFRWGEPDTALWITGPWNPRLGTRCGRRCAFHIAMSYAAVVPLEAGTYDCYGTNAGFGRSRQKQSTATFASEANRRRRFGCREVILFTTML